MAKQERWGSWTSTASCIFWSSPLTVNGVARSRCFRPGRTRGRNNLAVRTINRDADIIDVDGPHAGGDRKFSDSKAQTF